MPYLVHSSIIRCIKGEPSVEEYYEMALEAETHRESVTEAIMQLHTSQQFLTPGRLVVVKSKSVCLHPIGFPFIGAFFLFVSFLSMFFFVYTVLLIYFRTLHCLDDSGHLVFYMYLKSLWNCESSI